MYSAVYQPRHKGVSEKSASSRYKTHKWGGGVVDETLFSKIPF